LGPTKTFWINHIGSFLGLVELTVIFCPRIGEYIPNNIRNGVMNL
jgi:hypothetical protein